MISRRSLWVAGIVPFVALGFFLRAAASWRPVILGRFPQGLMRIELLDAWPDRVLYSAGSNQEGSRFGWFDVRSGQEHKDDYSFPRRTGMDGEFSWVMWLDGSRSGTLEVVDGKGVQHVFKGHEICAPERGEVSVRILPNQNRVLLLARDVLYEWEFANGHLKRKGKFDFQVVLPQVLARDGRTLRALRYPDFVVGDTRSGKVLKSVPVRTSFPMESNYLSTYGNYSLFDQRNNTMKVVDTSTGKALWSFPVAAWWGGEWFLDDSEENVFVRPGKEWQVRELKTGKIVRRLALVPGAESAAVSPDGATLYSVAKGVLYRQRVR